jgi:hypothetical protein
MRQQGAKERRERRGGRLQEAGGTKQENEERFSIVISHLSFSIGFRLIQFARSSSLSLRFRGRCTKVKDEARLHSQYAQSMYAHPIMKMKNEK